MPTPSVVERWRKTVDDPVRQCRRADWFVYLSNAVGEPLIRSFAQSMPSFEAPPSYEPSSAVIREILATCACEGVPLPDTRELRQRVIDWNIGAQYAETRPTPDGIPPEPPAEIRRLRAAAGAALRLSSALEKRRADDDDWYAALPLVAWHIVFARLGRVTHPLYNFVELETLPDEEQTVHASLCEELRAMLALR
jgi:hypothetical protein